MKKSDFFKKIWIPVDKRMPPDEESTWVLIWNYSWNEPMVQNAKTARYAANAMLAEPKQYTSPDRLFSHWYPIEKP